MALALTERQNRSLLDADNAYPKHTGRLDMKMIEFVLLAVGAVVGAFLRYIMVASPQTIAGLPVNVLAVNVIGSFILGLFSVLSIALNLNSNYTLLVATGFCGAFTTMSSFALETSNFMDSNRFILVSPKHSSQRRLIFRRCIRWQSGWKTLTAEIFVMRQKNVECNNKDKKE